MGLGESGYARGPPPAQIEMNVIKLPNVLLIVGTICLGLAAWSLLQAEVPEAVTGLGLGVLLFLYRQWALRQ